MSKNNNNTAVDIDTVDDITNSISKVDMSISDDDMPDRCANCGKEGGDSLKSCAACKLVKYCNRECQIAHRPQHKKECKKHAAELRDIALFKYPTQKEDDCPICFLRLPFLDTGSMFYSCCGKRICCGCIYAMDKNTNATSLCPFCRVPSPTPGEEVVKCAMKRVDACDAVATRFVGSYYHNGMYGLPQDDTKALELWHRAAELGHTAAYFKIGCNYVNGQGVDRDMKKAEHYYELAAMGGDIDSRLLLGALEQNAGNTNRAIKHYMIGVRGGDNGSLIQIECLNLDGRATKDDYTKALRAYQKYLNEVKSRQRDEAAAFDDKYKYID